jgi:UDP-glucose 4-epimerase
MSRILITGATGLIGRESVRQFTEKGHTVYAVCRGSFDFNTPLAKVMSLDFEIETNYERRLPTDIDCIVHLAQSDKFREFPDKSLSVFLTNTVSTVRLLDWASRTGVKHFVYASTGGVYSGDGRSSEVTTPLKSPGQLDFYFSSKLSSEAFAQCYSNLFSVAVLRFFFVYGRSQNRSMLMPRLYDLLSKGSPVALAGKDGFSFNPIHVSDAAKAIVSSAESPRSLLANVAGPEIFSLREVCEVISRTEGFSPNFDIRNEISFDIIGNTSVMTRELHKPQVRFSDAVSDLRP